MPKQVMVDAKNPIKAQTTTNHSRVSICELAAKEAAVPMALTTVRMRQLTRFIQKGAPSVPTK